MVAYKLRVAYSHLRCKYDAVAKKMPEGFEKVEEIMKTAPEPAPRKSRRA